MFRIVILSLIFFTFLIFEKVHSQTFEIKNGQFLMDGKRYQVLSGEIHYSRIPEQNWKNRLIKAKAMGLNTICTYVFWNFHEEKPGVFDFKGNKDIAKYIRLAKETGLNVILRPGPYVCSEWDFGGLPAWLLKNPNIRVRCMDPDYMKAVKRYLLRLGKELKGLLRTNGGPIIMIQLENEYGSYAGDKEYLIELLKIYKEAGFNVPIFTSDGPDLAMLNAGTLQDITPVINFGWYDNASDKFNTLDAFRKNIPHMCGEYWCGWFNHWGDKKWAKLDQDKQLKEIEWMLKNDKSFNLYMFHGGTNFAFYAGANYSNGIEPDITSYDYNSPLDEAGNPTPKYFALRELYQKFLPEGNVLPQIPESIPGIEIPDIKIIGTASLFSNLPKAIKSPQVYPMEYFDQNCGYILYRTKVDSLRCKNKLFINELHDIGYIFVNGKFIGKIDRNTPPSAIDLPKIESGYFTLDILVEAFGRINFGPHLIDRKGITDFVTIGEFTLTNWEVFTLPMEKGYFKNLAYSDPYTDTLPKFYKGSFNLDKTGDTYLDLSKWKNGVVWVNGHNLGRYREIGPQRDLFIPSCWLKKGENEIIIFDLELSKTQPLSATKKRIYIDQ
jgi:beta-galactosidase